MLYNLFDVTVTSRVTFQVALSNPVVTNKLKLYERISSDMI